MPTKAVKGVAARAKGKPRKPVCRLDSLVPYLSGLVPSPSTTQTIQQGGQQHCLHHPSHRPSCLQLQRTPAQPKLVTRPLLSPVRLRAWTRLALLLKLPPTPARAAPPTCRRASCRAQSGLTTTPASLARVQSVWPAQGCPGCIRMESASRLTPSPLR